MRPDSPEVILLMLGRLKSLGLNPAKLSNDLVLGLCVEPADLGEAEVEEDY